MQTLSNVTLQPLTIDDSSSYFSLSHDPSVYQFCRELYCNDFEQSNLNIQIMQKLSTCKSFKILNDEEKMIGVLKLETFDNVTSISYFIGKDYRNNGYAKSTIQTLFHSFLKQYANNFIMLILTGNTASTKVAKSSGMKLISNRPNKYEIYCKSI